MARSWLPVGSVVTLSGGVRPVMVVAAMVQDSVSGKWWDYMGYPFPEGMTSTESDYFFDASMVREVHQLGLVDAEALTFQAFLRRNEAAYFAKRAEQNQEKGGRP